MELTKKEIAAVKRLKEFKGRNGDIDIVCDAALRPPQPVTLPTHEGWWFEWYPVDESGIWFPKWCQNVEGWEWEHHSGEWLPCQPGHWLPVPMPPPLDGKGGG